MLTPVPRASHDLFKSAIGIQGSGFGPTGFKFKDRFGAGDMIDVVASLCHIEATPDWNEETQGLPVSPSLFWGTCNT